MRPVPCPGHRHNGQAPGRKHGAEVWVVAYLSDVVNVSHAVAVKPSVSLSRLVVSLTRITPSEATSMHWPPFASL